jgi:hypothetical protein
MTHAWCRDVARDAAVRAAEDGRTGPLPTLGEAIAAPFACAVCKGEVYDHRFKESCPRCGGDAETWFGHKVLSAIAIDGFRKVEEAWSMIPKTGSPSSVVEQENKGDSMRPPTTKTATVENDFAEAVERSPTVSKTGEWQSGMRTERVVLEVTHGECYCLPEWSWATILRLHPGESVRVVNDEERQEPPTTKTATPENDYVPPAPVSRSSETRQTNAERIGGGWWFPKYDKPSAPPPPPPAPPKVHRGSGVFDASGDEVPWDGVVATLTEQRDAAIRERDALRAARITQSLTADRFASAVREADTLRARVAELQAASGGGVSSSPSISGSGKLAVEESQEPVAWGVLRAGFTQIFQDDKAASISATDHRGNVVPLYREPPQTRGWLTEEEREALGNLVAAIRPSGFWIYRDQIKTVESLLARSSPPEVVLPENPYHPSGLREGFDHAIRIVRNELVNAGVPVKEVGK